MNKLIILSLLLSFNARANEAFYDEAGSYTYSQANLDEYYKEKGINFFKVIKSDSQDNFVYKKSEINKFQIKDWFQRDWYQLQKLFSFDTKKYTEHYGGKTFNQAKSNYFKELNFDLKKQRHNEEVTFYKEWGILNHPPQLEKLKNLGEYSKYFTPIKYEKSESPMYSQDFHQELDRITNTELTFNNKVYLLEDKHSYEKKIELIKGARKNILMSSLVFVCDDSTKLLVEELVKKAKQGIEVFILVDRFMSTVMLNNSCPDMMSEQGINVIKGNDFFKYEGNAVYHSKKLIVDFDKAIVGGQNMLDADNTSNGTDFKNRDIDLYSEGPLSKDIAQGFIDDYQHFFNKYKALYYQRTGRVRGMNFTKIRHAKRYYKNFLKKSISHIEEELKEIIEIEKEDNLRGARNYSKVLENKNLRSKGVCRFVQQSPYKDITVIGKAYLHYLENTRTHLAIMNPQVLDTNYKSFGEKKLIEKLDEFGMFNKIHEKVMSLADQDNFHIDLVTSGPDVAGNELIVVLNQEIKDNLKSNEIKDANKNLAYINYWNFHFGEGHYKNIVNDYLPKKNIDIWTHMSYLHSKIFYFDRIVSSVGSYNFHHNATDHAYENTIFCQDDNLNKQLDEVFVRDMVNSIPFKFKNLIR